MTAHPVRKALRVVMARLALLGTKARPDRRSLARAARVVRLARLGRLGRRASADSPSYSKAKMALMVSPFPGVAAHVGKRVRKGRKDREERPVRRASAGRTAQMASPCPANGVYAALQVRQALRALLAVQAHVGAVVHLFRAMQDRRECRFPVHEANVAQLALQDRKEVLGQAAVTPQ